jgi:hypothetical protein
MAFHNAGKVLAKAAFPQQVSPALCMADIMGPAPADIVEHRTLFNKMKIDIGIMCCIIAGTVPHGPAMGNDFCAAPGIAQHLLAAFFLLVRHGQATS